MLRNDDQYRMDVGFYSLVTVLASALGHRAFTKRDPERYRRAAARALAKIQNEENQ